MRITIDRGVYIQPVTANLVSEVLPTYFPDYEWYLLFQVYELDGSEAKGSYTGEGRITIQPHNEDFNVLVLGDPYRSNNLEEYLVSKNAIQDSIDSLDLITEALEFGWEKRYKKRGASIDWIEAFEFAKMQRKEYEGGSMARSKKVYRRGSSR